MAIASVRFSLCLLASPDSIILPPRTVVSLKISIVIPVIDEADLIQAAIERAWKAGGDEVIVVDGGSSDATAEKARQQECCFLQGPPGRGPQLNAGAEVATGDVLLFLHADGWLVKDGCQQIRHALETSSARWGGFCQQIESERWMYRWLEKGNLMRARLQRLVYGDQGMFVTRELFEQVGHFPAIPLMEDFEISRRLAKVAPPAMLKGPVHVSPRRWEKHGIVRQTLHNWRTASQYRLGRSPERLQKEYLRHNQS